MRGCVTAVLLSLLLAAPTVSGQCNYSAAYSGPFRATYFDVVANAREVWAATGYGVQLFGRSNAPSTVAASLSLPGLTRVIRGTGPMYAGSGTSIYVLTNLQPPCQVTCPWSYSISVAGSVDTGATVNDIAVTPNNLYVATSNGLQQYDLLNAAAPRLMATLSTSSPGVLSLSLSGSLLYAADGDSSVEVFDISIPSLPQKSGVLSSLPRATGVHATGSRIYVTDGQTTDIFVGSGGSASKVGNAAFGTTAFAALSGDTIFAAGNDRRIRAVDWSTAAAPVEVFATDVLPSGGSINRAAALTVEGGALYAAEGDAGIQAFDVNGFTAPFPVRSYTTNPTSSVIWAGGKLYAARTSGGIAEFTKGSSGTLTAGRQWDSHVQVLHDATDSLLLTSSGNSLYYWFLGATTPTLASSTLFKKPVVQSVVIGSTAYAVLDDQTLWSADLSQASPQPQAITVSIKPSAIARSGSALALAELRDDAVTTISYYASADLTKAPQIFAVQGLATTGVALSASTAAVFTYLGISVIDLASGTTTVLPDSNGQIAVAMTIRGTQLLELTESSLRLWDLAAKRLVRQFPLPARGSALAADQIAAIATGAGLTTVAFDSTVTGPRLAATRGANTYYRKVAATGDRLYLFDGRTIDIFSTTFGSAPHHLGAIASAGVVDFAVSDKAVFTISGVDTVTAMTLDGAPKAQAVLNEGSDIQLLSISTAGGAPWVSFSRGCMIGACQKQTAVLDPASLVRTAILEGAAKDVTTSGARAYAIFELPIEVRVYDETDPLHPSLTTSRAAEGSSAPVSVAQSNGTVYVAGEKLYAYSEATLTKTGELFAPFEPDAAGTYSYVDQRLRVDGTCGFLSGRSPSPQLFSVPAWTQTSAPTVPASVRSIAAATGRLYLLTDYSLEVWATQAPTAAPRRRPPNR